MSTPALFTPIQIGQHTLKHRIVMAPLTRFRADPTTGAPLPDLVSQYYQQRATAGGLIITEATAISPGAGAPIGTPGIYNSEQVKAWQQVTTAVHKKGGLIFMQMWHLGRAGSNPVSASDLAITSPSPLGGGAFDRPQALSVDGILAITQEFVQAAKNAIEAGFDGMLK
jgi:2,4-dienoyl-CoA reductase-like NADH-dependent reductase (Old Yellow Enzyme family)